MKLHTTVNCIEGTVEPSAIDKAISRLNSRINATNNQVSSITPYEESKQAYIGDTECVFTKVKDGIINANVITESGNSISNTMELLGEEIIVKFDELTEMATVKISIQ